MFCYDPDYPWALHLPRKMEGTPRRHLTLWRTRFCLERLVEVGSRQTERVSPMSHHFDTKTAKEDPSLNVCNFYLFDGAPGTTVMARTVNPDVGLSVPDVLHPEGLYAFRFDLNADAREEVAFKFRFVEPEHSSSDTQTHVQEFLVRRATGGAIGGDSGELLIDGVTGKTNSRSGVHVYAGTTPDLFAGNAVGLGAFLGSFYIEQRYNGDAFLNRQNYLAKRNITALVLEVPRAMIGQGRIGAWATTSLYGHAPDMQVQRWGLPLITHIFLSAGDELKDKFYASTPADDLAQFSKPIAEFTEKMTPTHSPS
jgi:Domain of unknown function (DUF4331)